MLLVVSFEDIVRIDFVLSQEARLPERLIPSYTCVLIPTINLSAIEGLICDLIIYRCRRVDEPRFGRTGFELDFDSLFVGL